MTIHSRTPIRDALSGHINGTALAGFRDYPEWGLKSEDIARQISAIKAFRDSVSAMLAVIGEQSRLAGAKVTEADFLGLADGLGEDLEAALHKLQQKLEEEEIEAVSFHDYASFYGGREQFVRT